MSSWWWGMRFVLATALLLSVATNTHHHGAFAAAADDPAAAAAGSHRIVHGGPPCNRNAYLAPTPTTLAAFESQVIESDEVFLVRIRDEEHLPCRILASTWEKLMVIFKDRIRTVEFTVSDPATADVARLLNVSLPDDLPFLHLFDGRTAAAARTASRMTAELNGDEPEEEEDGAPTDDIDELCEEAHVMRDGVAAASPSRAGRGCSSSMVTDDEKEPARKLRRQARELGTSRELLKGGGSGHAALRDAIEHRIRDLPKSSAGFALKRVV